MEIANLPDDEDKRLDALYGYDLLDSTHEPIFDTITELASSICKTPIAAITLIDKNRQWFKSAKGIKVKQTSRDVAFCAHTILGNDILEVANAKADKRFHDNPHVINEPSITFYAGAPLITKDGLKLGSLCVIDKKAKTLSAKQKDELRALADIIICLFDSRKNLADENKKTESYLLSLKELNKTLTLKLEQEKELTALINTFNEMNSLMQSCQDAQEATFVIKKYCKKIFSNASGTLYLSKPETDMLDKVITWDTVTPKVPSMKQNDCWALRRGQAHCGITDKEELHCAHLSNSHTGSRSLCLPLLSHGEILGLLSIEYQSKKVGDEFIQFLRSFSIKISEHIALALSNIHLRKKLHDESIKDPLTNVFNRRYLNDYFRSDLQERINQGSHAGIMIIDIDYFKKINDTYGHYIGDEVLKQLSAHISQHVKPGEIISRIGGEEFVLIFLGKDNEDIKEKARSLFQALNHFKPTLTNTDMPPVTLSIGLAICPKDGDTLATLLKIADTALYQAKTNGRSQLVISE